MGASDIFGAFLNHEAYFQAIIYTALFIGVLCRLPISLVGLLFSDAA